MFHRKKEGNGSKKKKEDPLRQKMTFGQKLADTFTYWGGSWTFLIIFFLIMVVWVYINTKILSEGWDPYPFILLNLILSCLAAIQAPIILMSQNRAAWRDRIKGDRDYAVNRKAEREIEHIKKELDSIKRLLQNKKK